MREDGKQFLKEAEGGETGEGGAAEKDAEDDSGENVTEEVHAEDDAREGDADCEEEKRDFEAGVEITEDERYGKRGHGVTGREGEAVGRKDARPAVCFDFAGARTLADALEEFKDEDADDGGAAGRAEGDVTLRAAEDKDESAESVPEPTVAHARGGDHPIADPARRAPTVHPPHQAVIATFDESPEVASHGHVPKPASLLSIRLDALPVRTEFPQHSWFVCPVVQNL